VKLHYRPERNRKSRNALQRGLQVALTPRTASTYASFTEGDPASRKSRWEHIPWWAWILIILFPVVLRPWWLAIISLLAFALFLIFILGPLLDRNKDSE
jgi:hypothetical protein